MYTRSTVALARDRQTSTEPERGRVRAPRRSCCGFAGLGGCPRIRHRARMGQEAKAPPRVRGACIDPLPSRHADGGSLGRRCALLPGGTRRQSSDLLADASTPLRQTRALPFAGSFDDYARQSSAREQSADHSLLVIVRYPRGAGAKTDRLDALPEMPQPARRSRSIRHRDRVPVGP